MHVMLVFGTRPEAVKMTPVIRALHKTPAIHTTVCVTGQHRAMLDQVLNLYGIKPDIDLDLMKASQPLASLLGDSIRRLGEVFRKERPAWVLVQGDTATTLGAALAAFYERIHVGHVEAGLRTYNFGHPWPEEMQRRVVGTLSTLHFAPTVRARENLLNEGVPEQRIVVTGNTVIDALLETVALLRGAGGHAQRMSERFAFLGKQPLLLVTSHRRENLDGGLSRLCQALRDLAGNHFFQVVFPVHRNPAVMSTVHQMLGGVANIHLIEPQDYLSFVYLMDRSWVIITDSGGIQEEAPSLQKPVLVARETTERPEAISAGTAELVGTDPERIKAAVLALRADPDLYRVRSTCANPFGDGHAAGRIVESLLRFAGDEPP